MPPSGPTSPSDAPPPRTSAPVQRRSHAVFGLLLVLLFVAFLAPIVAGVGAYLIADSFETVSRLQATLIGGGVAVLAMFLCNIAIMMPMAAMAGGLLKEATPSDATAVTGLLERLATRAPQESTAFAAPAPTEDSGESADRPDNEGTALRPMP